MADVPHEGMCRGAAANAKQGCKQLAKQTAITTNKMKTERITNSKINITPLPTCVLKAYTGQRNDVGGGNEKGPESINASRPADRSSALAWLSLVGMLARPTFGRCPAQLRFTKQRQCTRREKAKLQTSSAEGTSTPRKYDRKNCEPPLDANGSFRDVAPVAPGAVGKSICNEISAPGRTLAMKSCLAR